MVTGMELANDTRYATKYRLGYKMATAEVSSLTVEDIRTMYDAIYARLNGPVDDHTHAEDYAFRLGRADAYTAHLDSQPTEPETAPAQPLPIPTRARHGKVNYFPRKPSSFAVTDLTGTDAATMEATLRRDFARFIR